MSQSADMVWIPVSERLPEKMEMYYCHYSNGGTWWAMFRPGSNEWIHEGEAPGIVTHWMPLPAPPQEAQA